MSKSNRRQFVGKAGAATIGLSLAGSQSVHANAPTATRSQQTTLARRKRKIRIGQIGVGHAHANKLSVYRRSEDYEVVGIVEPDERRRKLAESQAPFRDLKWMTREQLFNVTDLDAVLIETEVKDLLDNAEAAIDAGFHIHLDKPAGESWSQFERVIKKAREKSLLVQMGYMYRYNPAIVLLREFLQKRWLGEVFEVHTVMSKTINAATRKSLAKYRGGMMFELGCHILDLVVGVLGSPGKVQAFNRHSSPYQDELQDNMLAVLEYEKATATIRSSAQEVEGFARRHFVVCGDQGTFHIQPLDRPKARVALSKQRGDYKAGYQEITFPKYERYVDDAADMVRIILGEKKTDFPYDHDLAVQKTLLTVCEMKLD